MTLHDDPVDYEAVVAALQRENERIRERLAKSTLSRRFMGDVSWYRVRVFISQPEFIVGFAIGVAFAIVYGLVPEKG